MLGWTSFAFQEETSNRFLFMSSAEPDLFLNMKNKLVGREKER